MTKAEQNNASVLTVVMILTLLYLAGCSKDYDETLLVPSPGGSWVAVELVSVGGPTLANSWAIRIRPSEGSKRGQSDQGCLAWESTGVGVQSVVWRSEARLDVGVPDVARAHDYEWTFKPKSCNGVEVVWRYEPLQPREQPSPGNESAHSR